MSSLAERLREAREESGLSQADLARRIGLKSQGAIGNLESGARKSTTRIAQISVVLGVEPIWLAEGRGPKRKISAGEGQSSTFCADPTYDHLAALFAAFTPRQQKEEIARWEAIARQNDEDMRELNARQSVRASNHAASEEIPRSEGRLYSKDHDKAEAGAKKALKAG